MASLASTALLIAIALLIPAAAPQSCIPLTGSSQCPAFNASSFSTDTTLSSLLYGLRRYGISHTCSQTLTFHSPFLAFVSSTQQFDTQLGQYVNSSYVQEKYFEYLGFLPENTADEPCRYQRLLGCGNVNLTNTTTLYARYTTSVICNSIVQNSIRPCGLSSADSAPLCAESCVSGHTSRRRRLLTPHRLDKQPVRKKLQSTVSSAATLDRATWTRYGQILRIVRFPATP